MVKQRTHKEQFQNGVDTKILNLKILKRKRDDAWGVFYSVLGLDRSIEYVRARMRDWETLDIAVKQLEQEMHLGDEETARHWRLRAAVINEPTPVSTMYVEEYEADKQYYAAGATLLGRKRKGAA